MTKSSGRRVARQQQRRQTAAAVQAMEDLSPAQEDLQLAGECMKEAEAKLQLLLRAEDCILGGKFRGPDQANLQPLTPDSFGGPETTMAGELDKTEREIEALIPAARLEFADAILAYIEAVDTFQATKADGPPLIQPVSTLDVAAAEESRQ
ncbi:MAG: hypothetical protein ACYSW8_26515 [Planctomycetota bacterium]|jgi:hypothetical protein